MLGATLSLNGGSQTPVSSLRYRLLMRQAEIDEWELKYGPEYRRRLAKSKQNKLAAQRADNDKSLFERVMQGPDLYLADPKAVDAYAIPARPSLETEIPKNVMARYYSPYLVNYRPPTPEEVMTLGDPAKLKNLPDNMVSAMATVDALIGRLGLTDSQAKQVREKAKYRLQRLADMAPIAGAPARGLTYSLIRNVLDTSAKDLLGQQDPTARAVLGKVSDAYSQAGISRQVAEERGATANILGREMKKAKKEALENQVFPALAYDLSHPGQPAVASMAVRGALIGQEAEDMGAAYLRAKVAEQTNPDDFDVNTGQLTGNALQAHLEFLDSLSSGATGVSGAVFGTGMGDRQWANYEGSPTQTLKQTYGFNPFWAIEAIGGERGSDQFTKGAFETAYNPLNLFRGAGDLAGLGVTGARIMQTPGDQQSEMLKGLKQGFTGQGLSDMVFRGLGEAAPILPVAALRGASALTRGRVPSIPQMVEASNLTPAEKAMLMFEPMSPKESIAKGRARITEADVRSRNPGAAQDLAARQAYAPGGSLNPLERPPDIPEGAVKPQRERPGMAQERIVTPQEREALDYARQQQLEAMADPNALVALRKRMTKALDEDALRQDGLTPNRDAVQQEIVDGQHDTALAARLQTGDDPRGIEQVKAAVRQDLEARRASQGQALADNQPDVVSARGQVLDAVDAETSIADVARLRRADRPDLRAPQAAARFDKYVAGVDPQRVPEAAVAVLRGMMEGGVVDRESQRSLRTQAQAVIDALVKRKVVSATDGAALRKAFWEGTSIPKGAKSTGADVDLSGGSGFKLEGKLDPSKFPPESGAAVAKINKKSGQELTRLELQEFTDLVRARTRKERGELASYEIDTTRPEGTKVAQKVQESEVGAKVVQLPPSKRQAYYEATGLVFRHKAEGDEVAAEVARQFKDAPPAVKQRADEFVKAVGQYQRALDEIEGRIDELAPGSADTGSTFADEIVQANHLNDKMREAYSGLMSDVERMSYSPPSNQRADYLDPLVRAANEATGQPKAAPTGNYKVPLRALPLYDMGVQWRGSADSLYALGLSPEQVDKALVPMIQPEIFDTMFKAGHVQMGDPTVRALDETVDEMKGLADRLLSEGEISQATHNSVLRTIENAHKWTIDHHSDFGRYTAGQEALGQPRPITLPPNMEWQGTVAERIAAAAGITPDEAAEAMNLANLAKALTRGSDADNPLIPKTVKLEDVPSRAIEIARSVWGKAREVVNARHASLNNKGKLAFAALYDPGTGGPSGFDSATRVGRRQGVFHDQAMQAAATAFNESLQRLTALQDVLTLVRGSGNKGTKIEGIEQVTESVRQAMEVELHELGLLASDVTAWLERIKNQAIVLDAGRPMVAVVEGGKGALSKGGRETYGLAQAGPVYDQLKANDIDLEAARSERQGALGELRDANAKKSKTRRQAALSRLQRIDAEIAHLESNGRLLDDRLTTLAADPLLAGKETGDKLSSVIAKVVVDLGMTSEGLVVSTETGRYVNLDVLFGDAKAPSKRSVAGGTRNLGGKVTAPTPMQAALEGFDKAMSQEAFDEAAASYGKTQGARLNKASVVESPDVVGGRVRGTTKGKRGGMADVATLGAAAGGLAGAPLLADFAFNEDRRKILNALGGAGLAVTYDFVRGIIDDLNSVDGGRRARAQSKVFGLGAAAAATTGIVLLGGRGSAGKTVFKELLEAAGGAKLAAAATGDSWFVAAKSQAEEAQILKAINESVPTVSDEIARQKVNNAARAIDTLKQFAYYAHEAMSSDVPPTQLFEKAGKDVRASKLPALDRFDALDQFLRKLFPHDPQARYRFYEGSLKSQGALNQIVEGAEALERRIYGKTTAPERNLLDKWLAGDGKGGGPGTGQVTDTQVQQAFGSRWADIQRETNLMMDTIDSLHRLSIESLGLYERGEVGTVAGHYWPRRTEFAGRRRIGWTRRITDKATGGRFGLVPTDYRSMANQEADLYAQEAAKLGEQGALGAVKPASMRPRGEGTNVGEEVWQDAVRNFGSYVRERADFVGRNVTAGQLKATADAIEMLDDLSVTKGGPQASLKDQLVASGMSDQEATLAQASLKFQLRSMQANILGRNAEADFFLAQPEVWGNPPRTTIQRGAHAMRGFNEAMRQFSGIQLTESQTSEAMEAFQQIGQDLNAGFLVNVSSVMAQLAQTAIGVSKGALDPRFAREYAIEMLKMFPARAIDHLSLRLGTGERLVSNVEKSGWVSRQRLHGGGSEIPVIRSRKELSEAAPYYQGTPMEQALGQERLSLKMHGAAKLQEQSLKHGLGTVADAFTDAWWESGYRYALKKGMPEEHAVMLADELTASVFPDRSFTKGLGTKANVAQALTKFQNDVLQVSREMNTSRAVWQIPDYLQGVRRAPRASMLNTGVDLAVSRDPKARIARGLASLAALSVGTYMTNEFYKRTIGYRPWHFDPINAVKDIWEVWSDPYTTQGSRVSQVAGRAFTNLYGGTPIGEAAIGAVASGEQDKGRRRLLFGEAPAAFGQESVWATYLKGGQSLAEVALGGPQTFDKDMGPVRDVLTASGIPGANQLRKTLTGAVNLYGHDDNYWDRFYNYALRKDDTFRPDLGDTALEYLAFGPHSAADQRRMKQGSPNKGKIQSDVAARDDMVKSARGE